MLARALMCSPTSFDDTSLEQLEQYFQWIAGFQEEEVRKQKQREQRGN